MKKTNRDIERGSEYSGDIDYLGDQNIFLNLNLNKNYNIYNTFDGLEIEYYLNKPIEYLSPDTNIISFCDEFNQPVDNLSNQIDTIYYGHSFNHPVDDLPNKLKRIYFAQSFNQSLDNLPDSVEEIRVCQFYSHQINKLPKNLKLFNVVHKTKTEFDFSDFNINQGEQIIYLNEPHDNYY